jgi:hypothetical protein
MILQISDFKAAFPAVIHKCPYFGDIDLYNISDSSLRSNHRIQVFPSGFYRSDARVFHNDKKVFELQLFGEEKSLDKETFG